MVKLCIKMFATGTTTADNVAAIIIPQNSSLVLISWNWLGYNAGAIGSAVVAQLSQMSSSSWTSNDARGIIDECLCYGDKAINFAACGNKVAPLPGIKFMAGDTIRLHRYSATAPTSLNITANLFLV